LSVGFSNTFASECSNISLLLGLGSSASADFFKH
jgi:hypothetical protein